MNNDTTLVLGATGKAGRRVLARLRLCGTPVRAASEDYVARSAAAGPWREPRARSDRPAA